MPTINVNSIKPNTTVSVTGIVDFSRIASQIEGKELEDDNARKIARGMRATDKPHTRLSISHASIDYLDPANPTLAEQFIAERMYPSKVHPDKGSCYTAINKSRYLPEVYCRDNKATNKLEPVGTKGEIASGVNVTLILRFFATRQNNGVSLDTVIVNEKPVRFGGGSPSANILAARGFEIVSTDTEDVEDIRSQLDAVPAPTSPIPPAAPYMQPAPAPVNPVAVNMPAPAPAAVAPAPAAAVAPAPVQAVAPEPAQDAAPAPSLPTPPKGYVYAKDGRIVPENSIPPEDVMPLTGSTENVTPPTGGIKL